MDSRALEYQQIADAAGRRGLFFYLRVATLVLGMLLLLAMALLLPRQYKLEEERLLAQIEGRIVDRAYSLNEKLANLSYQVDGMRRWAELALDLPGGLPPSPLLEGVQDLPDTGTFTLDRIPGGFEAEEIGNIYGLGSVDTLAPLLRDELNMALWMFPMHQAALEASPELAWAYYDSIGVIYAISPWIHSDRMLRQTGAETLAGLLSYALEMDFIQLGTPQRNPERLPYWTPLYMDPAGKGLMVTHGAPVYTGDRFRGIVAADLTLDFLTSYLEISELHGHPVLAITRTAGVDEGILAVGEAGLVISVSGGGLPPDEATELSSYLPGDLSPDKVFSAVEGFTRQDRHFVLNVPLTVAPWSLVHVCPVTEVRKAVLNELAPLIISFVLLLGVLAALYLLLWRQMHEHERFERTLRRLAVSDPLTGVYNQRHFRSVAEVERERARRHHHPLSLLFMDIDHFKQINDSHGHAAGDQVLKAFVLHCQRRLRSADTLARLGGEEFAVILPETDLAGAARAAEQLREELAAEPIPCDGQLLPVTVSIGVAAMLPDETVDGWVGRADQAMYEAKRQGRNRVEVSDPEPGAVAVTAH
ncbi:MAG: diguanylate cyclase [Halothiobacillaceae bacterium]